MNTSIKNLIGVTALLALLLAATETKSIAQDTTDLQPVSWSDLPANGTFWVQGMGGVFPVPYPCKPQYVSGETAYLMDDGAYLVDARSVNTFAMMSTMSAATTSQQTPFGANTPADRPLLVTSNAWFNQIAISNHTYVSLGGLTLDGNGNVMTRQLPYGVMFPVTTTNLTTPMAQWQPVGQTNAIGNTNFSLPFCYPDSFFRMCAVLDTNANPDEVLTFSLMASNVSILTDQQVTLTWTNGQPGLAPENDAVVEMDSKDHSYLVSSVITTGAVGRISVSCRVNGGMRKEQMPAAIAPEGFQAH